MSIKLVYQSFCFWYFNHKVQGKWGKKKKKKGRYKSTNITAAIATKANKGTSMRAENLGDHLFIKEETATFA